MWRVGFWRAGRGGGAYWTAVRDGSGIARHGSPAGDVATNLGEGWRDPHRAAIRKESGGCAGGAFGGAVERCGSVYAPSLGSAEPQPGFPARPYSAGESESGARWIFGRTIVRGVPGTIGALRGDSRSALGHAQRRYPDLG